MEALRYSKQKGQGLIEALIALGAAVVIISTIAVAAITAVNNSDFSKSQNTATTYAQQGLEVVRAKAKNNWTSFSTYSGDYCLAKDSTDLSVRPNNSGNCALIDNFFMRIINVSQNSATCPGTTKGTKVTSQVLWSDGKCTNINNKYCHKTLIESCLANIDSVPAP